MAKLKVYEYPHPILKKKSAPVAPAEINDDLRQTLDDMLETMYEEVGVGLAAPQVGLSKRIIVIDAERDDEGSTAGNPMFFINPEIIFKSQEKICGIEGCLSVPEQRAEVERFAEIEIRYLDRQGKEQKLHADGFLAIVLQHEIDHLDGILYIDRISRLKRQMLVKKLEKMRKEQAEG